MYKIIDIHTHTYPNAIAERAKSKEPFTPMISKPIIPVEVKIVSIIKTVESRGAASLEDILIDEATLPDMIASFLGVLELVKVRKLLIADTVDGEWTRENAVLGADTRFIINENKDDIEQSEYLLDTDESTDEQLTIGVDD